MSLGPISQFLWRPSTLYDIALSSLPHRHWGLLSILWSLLLISGKLWLQTLYTIYYTMYSKDASKLTSKFIYLQCCLMDSNASHLNFDGFKSVRNLKIENVSSCTPVYMWMCTLYNVHAVFANIFLTKFKVKEQ